MSRSFTVRVSPPARSGGSLGFALRQDLLRRWPDCLGGDALDIDHGLERLMPLRRGARDTEEGEARPLMIDRTELDAALEPWKVDMLECGDHVIGGEGFRGFDACGQHAHAVITEHGIVGRVFMVF